MTKKNSVTNWESFNQGIKDCLPTVLGYWAVAAACGALGPVCGLTFWQIEFLTIFLYAGSAQLVFCSLYAAHAGILQLTFSVALINLRYLLMGAYVAKFFSKSSLFEKIVGSALITDETFSVATQYARTHNDELPFYWLLGLNLTAWINWITATTVGALIGTLIPKWANEALNFSLVGMFIGLLILTIQCSYNKISDYFVVIVAIISVAILHNYISKNFLILIITLFSALAGTIFYKYYNRNKNLS